LILPLEFTALERGAEFADENIFASLFDFSFGGTRAR
jgi:hypothetical protein